MPLFIVATPIGNLEDITIRALKILKEKIDYIFCEDTRISKKLLNHYNISIPAISLHSHSPKKKIIQAIKYLEELEGKLYISAITVAELFSGVRGDEEEQALEQFLLAFEIINLDQRLAKQGGLYRLEFHPSHGTGLADALIAASAVEVDAILVTFNRRHYPMCETVSTPYRRN